MKFTFICPKTGKIIHTENFRIIEDHGIKIDSKGNRFMDAEVKLDDPCPYCGKHHVYPVNELACPF